MTGTNTNANTTANSRIYISRAQLLNIRHESSQAATRQTRRQNSNLTGDILSTIKGHGIEFADIRPYHPGDEVRHIDWRTTARTGNPYTREYNEERQHTIYLSVDQRINMFFGSELEFKSFSSARIAATIAWAAVDRGYRLGGTVIGTAQEKLRYTGSVRTGPAKKTTLKLINELSLANNALSIHCPTDRDEAAGLDQMLAHTLAHRPTGSTVYLISDFHGFNKDTARTLSAIGRKCHLVMIRISDPLEEQLPDSGPVGISDGTQHQTIRLTHKRRQTYLQNRQIFLDELQHSADSCGALLMHHQTST